MTLDVSEQGIRGSSWRRTFADALIRLRPDMNPDAADEVSDSAYLSLGELKPDQAAAHYRQDCMGRKAVSQGAASQAGIELVLDDARRFGLGIDPYVGDKAGRTLLPFTDDR